MDHSRRNVENEIVSPAASLPRLAYTSRIHEVKLLLLETQDAGGCIRSGDLAPFIPDPNPLQMGVPEEAGMNGGVSLLEKVEDSLGLEHVEDVRTNAFGSSMTEEIAVEQGDAAWQRFQVPAVLFRELSRGVMKGLVGEHIEVFGNPGIQDRQIVISHHSGDPALSGKLQALTGIGIVSHEVSQVDQMIDAILPQRLEDCLQGLEIPVNIG